MDHLESVGGERKRSERTFSLIEIKGENSLSITKRKNLGKEGATLSNN